MEFSKENLINTTTAVTLQSNTILAQNLFNPDVNYQCFSEGYSNDLTTTSITINFDSTTPVSRIAMLEHNLKEYSFYYNGATANAINLNGAHTTTASFNANSDTAQFFKFDTIQASSITLDMKATQVADKEKVISFLYMADLYFEFDRVPSANGYKPTIAPKQIVHRLGDGGTKIHNIDAKFNIDITFKYLTEAQRDQLRTIYDLKAPFYFTFMPTATAWDSVFFEANWPGAFDFLKYSDNAVATGFSGKIKLQET